MSIPTEYKIKLQYTQNFYGEIKKILFPYKVQVLLFSPTLPFFLVLYSKHSFTFVYTSHLWSVQERLHKIHSRVCLQSNHHIFSKISWNIELTLMYISIVHFPSRVRGIFFVSSWCWRMRGRGSSSLSFPFPAVLLIRILFLKPLFVQGRWQTLTSFHSHWTVADWY